MAMSERERDMKLSDLLASSDPIGTLSQAVGRWSAPKCVDCGRVFDLSDETDADEWHYGHDCEV